MSLRVAVFLLYFFLSQIETWAMKEFVNFVVSSETLVYSIHLYEMISNQFEANQGISSLFYCKKEQKLRFFSLSLVLDSAKTGNSHHM